MSFAGFAMMELNARLDLRVKVQRDAGREIMLSFLKLNMSTKKQRIEAAKLLGSAKSPAKAEAARRNAKLPRKKTLIQKIEIAFGAKCREIAKECK